jgi:hypothetical protein
MTDNRIRSVLRRAEFFIPTHCAACSAVRGTLLHGGLGNETRFRRRALRADFVLHKMAFGATRVVPKYVAPPS